MRDECRRRIRGLYGIADSGSGDPVRVGAALLAGGCRLLQLRCKGWSPDEVTVAGRALLGLCRRVDACLIVNDHAELAVTIGAHGVHVGQTDGPTSEIRRIVGDDRLLGRSTNSAAQIDEALEGADYLAFGPLFPTGNLSRPKPVQGLDQLRAIRPRVPVPLVGIGGITRERLPEVRAAGADAWAVIGAIANADDPIAATRAFMEAG